MPVSVLSLAAPTGASATPAAGGSLAANTTYFYRLVCVENLASDASQRCSTAHVFSPPTAEFSATTTTTNRTINLAWTNPTRAIAGELLGILVFRTTTAGDYSNATAKLIVAGSGSPISSYPTTLNNVSTFADDGTRTLARADLYTTGIPVVRISGGSAGAPNTEADIYDAYVAAGVNTALYQRSVMPDGFAYAYTFWGCIEVSAANTFITINRGRSVLVFGRFGVMVDTTVRIGAIDAYGTGLHGHGTSLGVVGCTHDGNTQGIRGNVIVGASRIYDATSAVKGTNPIGTGYNLSGGINLLGGSATPTQGSFSNCLLHSYGSNNQYVGNIKFDNCVIEGAPRIEASGNYVPEIVGTTFLGSPLYSFSSPYTRVDRCRVFANSQGDIQFHGGSLTTFRVFDLVDHTSTNEPLRAVYSVNNLNSAGTFYLRRWSLSGVIADASGVAQQNAQISIVNASGNSDVYLATGATISGGVAQNATTITVSNGALFAGNDKIKVEAEVMLVTAVTGNNLTVTRAQDGTVQNIWSRPTIPVFKQADAVTTNASGQFETQYYLSQQLRGNNTAGLTPFCYDTTSYGPHVTTIRKYGYKTVRFSGNVTAPIALATRLLTDPVIQQATVATVLAYTGIAIDHAAKKITLGANRAIRELYDFCQANLTLPENMRYPDFFFSGDGVGFSTDYDIDVGAFNLTGEGTLSMPTKTFSFTTGTTTINVTDSTGESGFIVITGLSGHNVLIQDNANATIASQTNFTGTLNQFIPIPATGTWKVWIRKLGQKQQRVDVNAGVGGTTNIGALGIAEPIVQQSDAATVGAYTGIAIDHVAKKITLTANRTVRELIDFVQNDLAAVANLARQDYFTSTDGINYVLGYDLDIGTSTLGGTGTIAMPARVFTVGAGGSTRIAVTDSSGTTGFLTVSGLVSQNLNVANQAGTQVEFSSDVTGAYTRFLAAGSAGIWPVTTARYGFKRQFLSFDATGGGEKALSVVTFADPVIQEPVVANVAAYPGITFDHATKKITISAACTIRQLYDYCQYDLTLSGHIHRADFFTSTDGVNFTCLYDIDLGAVMLSGAGANLLMTGNTLTVASGGETNVTVTDSTGTTGYLTITGLANHNYAVINNSGVQVEFHSGVTGTATRFMPQTSTGVWKVVAAKYGAVRYFGSFDEAGGGPTTLQVVTPTNNVIQQTTAATVAAYTGIAVDHVAQKVDVTEDHTMREVYDYTQWDLTTEANIAKPEFLSSKDGNIFSSSYNLATDYNFDIIDSTLSGNTTLSFNSGAQLSTTNGTVLFPYSDANGTHVYVSNFNLPKDARVQLYDVTNSVEISNELVTGANGYAKQVTFTAPRTIRMRVAYYKGATDMENLELFGTLTASGLSFTSSLANDLVYNTNAVDGGLVVGLTADYTGGKVQVNSTDLDGTLTPQQLYAWVKYESYSENGIRHMFNQLLAEDAVNFKVPIGSPLLINNTTTTPLFVTGGRLYRADNASIIAAGSDSIQFDSGRVFSLDSKLLDMLVEPGVTVRDYMRVDLAVSAGKTTVTDIAGGKKKIVFRDPADTKDRVTAEVLGAARTKVTTDMAESS